MIDRALLHDFCAGDDWEELSRPFSVATDGHHWDCATDGHVFIALRAEEPAFRMIDVEMVRGLLRIVSLYTLKYRAPFAELLAWAKEGDPDGRDCVVELDGAIFNRARLFEVLEQLAGTSVLLASPPWPPPAWMHSWAPIAFHDAADDWRVYLAPLHPTARLSGWVPRGMIEFVEGGSL